MSVIAFSSAIGPIPIDCVVSENHMSTLEVTSIAIESGAKITDHAVVQPKSVVLDIADRGAAVTYAALVAFQESRVPFTLVTGLSIYRNMLIKSISTDRKAGNAYILSCKVDLTEAIIVDTAYAADPEGDAMGQRGAAGGKNSTRAAAPAPERAKDSVTADRVSGTNQRGDSGVTTASPSDAAAVKSAKGGSR
ncbi:MULTISPECIES: phage baseplate protein [unclassified Sinorhizobium]|uniref:phage baseplate protein n=1 Tax=unclassified Sinorhizobium TaxID=2613772 RepID=UPI0035239DE8